MRKSIFRRRLFVALFSGLFMGMLCACNGGNDQEESTIAEEEQAQEESAEREMYCDRGVKDGRTKNCHTGERAGKSI